ncbi:MAG: hypothetical protein AB1305_06050 [Candidatus Hadarchaeota archaeon]
MPLTISEDVFSALMVTLLFSFFIISLIHAWGARDEMLKSMEEFSSTIGVAEQLRDQVLAGPYPGLLEPSRGRLDNFARSRQLNLSVEVRSLEGAAIFSYGQMPEHSTTVGLPAALDMGDGSAMPCELVVGVWKL